MDNKNNCFCWFIPIITILVSWVWVFIKFDLAWWWNTLAFLIIYGLILINLKYWFDKEKKERTINVNILEKSMTFDEFVKKFEEERKKQ